MAYEAGRRCVLTGISDNAHLCPVMPAATGGKRTVRLGHLSESRKPETRGASMDDLQTILTTDVTGLNDEEAVRRTGELIDLATDHGDESGLVMAVSWCESVQARPLGDPQRALLHYFEANAWSS